MPAIPGTPQLQTPRADISTDASANSSLSSGSSYSEQAQRNGLNVADERSGRPMTAEPLTEFQRFVNATTGRMLPIFGARLFAARPAAFGPIEHGPAPQDMVIGAGDELRIRIWGQVNFSADLRVSREGEIYLPKAGDVHVAGLAFSTVAAHLRQALERVYRNFELSVDMGEIHSIQVYVTGQARQPGEYTVSALDTLVAGSMRHVALKREGKVLADFDLYALLVKGDKTGDVQLQSGDVLYIPPWVHRWRLWAACVRKQSTSCAARSRSKRCSRLPAAGLPWPPAGASQSSVSRIMRGAAPSS
jgi:protein involved in polysaccharide export with SLBB domain